MKHEDSSVCPCHPSLIPVERSDGSLGWVTAHKEPNQTPEQEAERLVRIFEAMDDIKNG